MYEDIFELITKTSHTDTVWEVLVISECRQSPAQECGVFLCQVPESSVFMRTFRHFSGIIEVSNYGRCFYL